MFIIMTFTLAFLNTKKKKKKIIFNKNASAVLITLVVPVTVHIYKDYYLLLFNQSRT